jgi:hypothetical protein
MTKTSRILPIEALQICVSADEFVARHSLSLNRYYAILSSGVRLLPEIFNIAGEIRLYDTEGTKGVRFAPEIELDDATPGGVSKEIFIDVGSFFLSYGLTNEILLKLAIRGDLPIGKRSDLVPKGEVLVSAKDIKIWEMARRTDLMEV